MAKPPLVLRFTAVLLKRMNAISCHGCGEAKRSQDEQHSKSAAPEANRRLLRSYEYVYVSFLLMVGVDVHAHACRGGQLHWNGEVWVVFGLGVMFFVFYWGSML